MVKNSTISIFILVLLFAVSVFIDPIFSAEAAVSPLSGYAWSSNIGWISFNSANPNSGGGSYSVKYDSATKLLTDHAWSSNIGWISFKSSDLAGCPASPCEAKVVGNSLNGWARAIAGIGRTDGWDGWISLKGASPDYGVFKTGASLSGYAWGSNVVGWISFSGGSGGNAYGVALPSNANASSIDVYLSNGQGMSPSTANAFTFAYGDTLPTSINWDVQNTSGLTCSATASAGLLALSAPGQDALYLNGSRALATGLNTIPGTYTFTANCGSGVSDSIILTISPSAVPQTFSLSANPASRQANFILSPSSPKTFTSTVTLNRGTGFNRNIDLTTSTTDADGITVALSSSSFTAGTDLPITATINVYKDLVTQGVHRVRIHGATNTGTPVTSDLDITITVSKTSSSGEI